MIYVEWQTFDNHIKFCTFFGDMLFFLWFQHKIDISSYVLMDKMTHIYETRHTSYNKSDIFTTHPGNPP